MSCKCYWSHVDCGEHSVATKVTEDTVVYARTSIAFGKSKTLSGYFSTSSEMILRSALWTNFPHLKIIVSITSAHLIVRWSLRSCQQIESWNDDRCSHTAERSGESWQMTSDRVHRYFRLWVAERPSGESQHETSVRFQWSFEINKIISISIVSTKITSSSASDADVAFAATSLNSVFVSLIS